MRKARYTETQILKILKEAEAGIPLTDLCREHGFGKSTFYKWKAKYGGMDASALRRMKELEEENRRLKQMYAELSLDHEILKDIVEKSCNGGGAAKISCVRYRTACGKRTTGMSVGRIEPQCVSLRNQKVR